MNLDQVFNAIGTRSPSFAGTFFDESGVLVVRLTRLEDSATTWQTVRDALSTRIRVDPMRGKLATGDTVVAPRGLRFEQAAVSFATLYQLKLRIADKVFQDDGTTFSRY